MDHFAAGNSNENASSDASDIDLDDIAKMIDPLDDLEDNLFSSKAKQNPLKNAQTNSLKKVIPSEATSLTGKDAEETEILTSMSSNNGQHMIMEDDIFGDLLQSRRSEQRVRISDIEVNGAEKHNTLKEANIYGSKESEVNEEIKTGLWSGDDLWSLGRNTRRMKERDVHPSSSPVKSYEETGQQSINSPSMSPKPYTVGNLGPRQRRRSNNPENSAKRNKKPGKFDWLGLLESSDEEKQLSLKSSGQEASLNFADSSKEEFNRISNPNSMRSNEFLGSSHLNDEDVPKVNRVSSDISSRGDHSLEKNRASLRDSLVKDEESAISKITMAAGSKIQHDKSSSISVRDDAQEALKDMAQAKVNGKNEEVNKLLHEIDERSNERERQTAKEKASKTEKASLSEENEESSVKKYAPTFIGDRFENPGRRRRRNENGDIAMKAKETFSANFDPLGLFLMDEKDGVDVNGSENTHLPEWLTGTEKKSVIENQSLNPVKKEQHSPTRLEPKVDITVEMDAESSKDEETTFKGNRESFEKVSNKVETNLKVLHEGSSYRIEEKDISNASYDITLDKSNLSFERKESSGEELSIQQKSTNVISTDEKLDRNKLLSKVRKKTKRNVDVSEEETSVIESNSEEYLEKKDLEQRRPTKKHHQQNKRRSKGKEDIKSEDGDHSSVNAKKSPLSTNAEIFKEKEAYYLRKIRDLEEKLINLEYIEDDLVQMNHLKGEVEHLRAVIHVLELEKSTTESLVTSLQERHKQQIERLEEVHRNEVNSLKEALSREEKRGDEEIRRLTEDHRKTVERLMEANVRMEEEFRNRMLEARKDWSRDMEAMRLAYQQSSNAAITNASLAVLTGHGVGALESKDKSEISKKDDSSLKSGIQCQEEVKELSESVERVESILMQTLEVITPKVKNQRSKVKNSLKGRNQEKWEKCHNSGRDRKRVYYKAPRKVRRFIHNRKGRIHSRHAESDLDENLETDSSQQLGEASGKGSINGSHSSKIRNKSRKMFSEDVCQYCNRCQHCSKRAFSPDSEMLQKKADKDGKNKQVYNKEPSGERFESVLSQDYGSNRHFLRQSNDKFWKNEVQERKRVALENFNTAYDYLPSAIPPSQPGIIIDPKQYLMKLAYGNQSNLFQPMDIFNV